MSKIFQQECLLNSIAKDKAKARKEGKIAQGFTTSTESVTVKEMLSGTIAVVNNAEVAEPEKEEIKEDSKEEAAVVEEKKESLSISLDDVERIVNKAIAPTKEENDSLKNQLNAIAAEKSAIENQLSQTKEELEAAKKDAKVLESIAKLSGSTKIEVPMINTKTSMNDSPKGLADELVAILSDPIKSKITAPVGGFSPATGQMYLQHRDPREAGRFIQESFTESRKKGGSWKDSQLIKDVEKWAQSQGFIGGGDRVVNAAGATTGASGSAPNAFLDVLSAIMRETHSQSNIFWQFTTTAFDATSAPGKNILVPRFNFLPAPTTISDYLIADTTNYNPIGLTIGTGSDSQNLEMTTVAIACSQWGIGRGQSIGTRPVFIPEFHDAMSLVNLMDAVDSRLMQHYYKFEELLIRTEFEKATTIVYNDKGSITSTVGNIDTGDDATMTREFLTAVYSQMYAAQIPTYPDGSYVLVLNPTASSQLKLSYDKLLAQPTLDQVEAVSNMLRQTSGFDFGRVSNYLGFSPDGFHLFVGNSFGVGAAGASPTVNTSAFTSGNTVTNDSFVFGPGCVGRGIASPMEVRSQGSPFELGTAFIWVERGGTAPMDLDSSLSTGQQTRCWRLRTSRTVV
jgi:hypothetical protein